MGILLNSLFVYPLYGIAVLDRLCRQPLPGGVQAMMFRQSDTLCCVSTTAQNVNLSASIRFQNAANLLPTDWALKTPILVDHGSVTLRANISDEVVLVTRKRPSGKATTCLSGMFTSRDGVCRVTSFKRSRGSDDRYFSLCVRGLHHTVMR